MQTNNIYTTSGRKGRGGRGGGGGRGINKNLKSKLTKHTEAREILNTIEQQQGFTQIGIDSIDKSWYDCENAIINISKNIEYQIKNIKHTFKQAERYEAFNLEAKHNMEIACKQVYKSEIDTLKEKIEELQKELNEDWCDNY